ncbi:MAG: hypothetical protein ABEJ22_03790 [Haloferacaceae archaeon]
MPSRRTLLAGLGSAALAVATTGCLDARYAPSAFCQLKVVDVEWTDDRGRRWRDEILWAMADPEDRRLYARVAEEFASVADGPAAVSVSADLESELRRTFLAVDYLLGFCGPAFRTGERDTGCRNTSADSRADFERLQVGDDAAVSLVDHAFRVHGVDERDTDDWRTEFHTFSFADVHEDHGAPV